MLLICAFITPSIASEAIGRYVSIERISLTSEIEMPSGAEVNFLGVIDVPETISVSGKLATFVYRDQVYNANAALFYKSDTAEASFYVASPRSYDAGNSASVCSKIYKKNTDDALQFADNNFSRFLQITQNDRIIDDYGIKKPENINSRNDRDSEFCITGLTHSNHFKITLLPGLMVKRDEYNLSLDKPISFQVKTPPITPAISLDGSKTTLSNAKDAVIPIDYVNINQIEVSLHQIDLSSLPSYSSVLRILDGSDVNRLDSFWGSKIAQKTITVENILNERKTINLNFSDLIGPRASGLFVATFTSPDIDMSFYENRPTQWFSISDTSVQIFKGLNSTTLLVNSFKSTQGIENATVEIVAQNNRTLFEGTTDNNGYLEVSNDLISGSDGFSPAFIFIRSEKYGTSILQVSSLDKKPRFLDGGEIKVHQEDVYITSDRRIYRPGDTVNVFGALRTVNLDTISAQEFTLSLIDRDNDPIFEEDLKSSAHGAFIKSIFLKNSLPLGSYSLQVKNVDNSILAQHTINLEDFVPLTIKANLEVQNKIWKLGIPNEITLSGQYFSGGPSTGLDTEILGLIKTTNTFQTKSLSGYVFGSNSPLKVTSIVDEFKGKLNEDGVFQSVFEINYDTDASHLYEVQIDGVVFDVGGRPNKTTEILPLDTSSSYVGIKLGFGEYVDEGIAPNFEIINVDRAGNTVGLEGVNFEVRKVYYSYNWYYDDGWNWRRVRISDETVTSGAVRNNKLTVPNLLNWGRYEIVVSNKHGFTTVREFYVGWGSDIKPISQPEELLLTYSDGMLRGSAQFAGKLSVLLADEDIEKIETTDIPAGDFSIPVNIPVASEPGVHLLASLIRPVDNGSEHLPQISLGKVWVPTINDDRIIDVTIQTKKSIDSSDPISIKLATTSSNASAVIFLVDEGIHALTGYQNKNLRDHYLSERALNYGIISNFGDLISQDLSLPTLRVGGDILSSVVSVEKSDFFKTVADASPILEIENGFGEFTFPETLEWEGELRVVVFVLNEKGFGFSEASIIVQDPVSLDVSMPRFTTPNAKIEAAMKVRWNEYSGPVTVKTTIGSSTNSTTIGQPASNSLVIMLPISTNSIGEIPINIDVVAGERTYERSYSIVSRQRSYPATETQSVKLKNTNSGELGSVLVQPYNWRSVDLNAKGSALSASLTTTIGVNLHQVTEDLDLYPYGCVEQVSSKARGLIAYANVRGIDKKLSDKLNSATDNLLAKQKYSGAFGYWDRNSYVYERFQPYAVHTLQLLLPFSKEQDKVTEAINSGLEYLYRTNFDDPRVKLYSYGLLAKSGYEVTSRARYAIDQELKSSISFAKNTLKETPEKLSISIENLTLAYWVAVLLNDTKRMQELSDTVQVLLKIQLILSDDAQEIPEGAWYMVHDNSDTYGLNLRSAPESAHLLTDLDPENISSVFEIILANTHEYLSQKQYRSTIENAKLVALQLSQKQSLTGTKVDIDGSEYQLDPSGILPLTLDQLKWGFEISHNASTPLYLNVTTKGQRLGMQMLDNGYQVLKFWYDRDGNVVDVKNGVIESKQGDLFTVVIEVDRTKGGVGSDVLVTDLIPAGFEIEDATLSDPVIDGQKIDFKLGIQSPFTQSMDDRFIAHFDQIWETGDFAYIRYTLRATHRSNAIIGDTYVEEMYAPEINGRSDIVASIIASR